jgi:hypothetical protein
VAPSFPARSKPIKAISRTTKPHSRETLQESGKASCVMNWIFPGKQTDISFIDENAADSIRHDNGPDEIHTDERDWQ